MESPHGYKAAWRSSLEENWVIGHIYVDDPIEALRLAKECIDFNYRADALEVELGRKLTTGDLKRVSEE